MPQGLTRKASAVQSLLFCRKTQGPSIRGNIASQGGYHSGQTLFSVFDRSSSRCLILMATLADWSIAASARRMRLLTLSG